MLVGKQIKLSDLFRGHVENEDDNKITSFISDLKLKVTINLNKHNAKAESRVLEQLLKESLEELPPTTVFPLL